MKVEQHQLVDDRLDNVGAFAQPKRGDVNSIANFTLLGLLSLLRRP